MLLLVVLYTLLYCFFRLKKYSQQLYLVFNIFCLFVTLLCFYKYSLTDVGVADSRRMNACTRFSWEKYWRRFPVALLPYSISRTFQFLSWSADAARRYLCAAEVIGSLLSHKNSGEHLAKTVISFCQLRRSASPKMPLSTSP